jgi:hypothetical protein
MANDTTPRKRGRPPNGKGAQFTRDNPGAKLVINLTKEDMDDLAKMAVEDERTPGAQARYLLKTTIASWRRTKDL